MGRNIEDIKITTEETLLVGDTVIIKIDGVRYLATVGLPTKDGHVKLNHIRKEEDGAKYKLGARPGGIGKAQRDQEH